MFINIKFQNKSFEDKKRKQIHIEHSIPVKQIYDQMKMTNVTGADQISLWLLKNPIGTAFHQSQCQYLIKDGYNSRSDAYNNEHPDFNKPYNFTVDDHISNVNAIIKKFNIVRLM